MPSARKVHNRIIDDHELVQRLQSGDEWVFHLLVRRFRARLFGVAFGITMDAEESRRIVLEVFLMARRRIVDFGGEVSLTAWLRRMTVRRCFTWRRRLKRRFRQQRRTPCPPPFQTQGATPPDRRSVAKMRDTRVDSGLRSLSTQARAMLVLREVEGLDHGGIADATGSTVERVRSLLLDAHRRLMARMLPDGQDAVTVHGCGGGIDADPA